MIQQCRYGIVFVPEFIGHLAPLVGGVAEVGALRAVFAVDVTV